MSRPADLAALVRAVRNVGIPAGPAAPSIPRVVRLAAAVLDGDGHRLAALFDEAGWLDRRARGDLDPAEFAEALKRHKLPARPPVATACLRAIRWFDTRFSDEEEDDLLVDRPPTEALRDELLALRGIGPATADRILLEVFDRPVAPVDRGGYRIAVRHGWIDPTADRDEARAVFESWTPTDAAVRRSVAEGLAVIAARHCRVRRADCGRCPLQPFLPEGGPVEPDGV